MSFLLASSHPSEDNRPEEEEEDENVQPMQRSGMVRAFSHLPQRAQGEPAAPRPFAPTYLPSWATQPSKAEHDPEAETAPDSHGDRDPPAAAGSEGVTGLHAVRHSLPVGSTRPFDQSGFSGSSRSDTPDTSYADAPPETTARGEADGQCGDSWDNRPPQTRPDTPTATTGRWFEKRSTPEEFFTQHGLGASGPSSKQRPQESQRAVAALQQQVSASNPPAQSGRLAAQPQSPAQAQRSAAGPAQNAPAAPPPLAAGGIDPISPAPKTTIRIGNYPAFEKLNASQKEIDEWNTTFRKTYGKLAADAARKHGVPARLLAALSANEVAAPNWNALNAFADRNTLLTKSVGPLQISAKTALKYKLVPIDNEFYGLPQSDIWAAMHDPDLRYAGQSPSQAPDAQHQAPARDLPAFTPSQNLLLRRTPYPTSIYDPNGSRVIHDYLDNPATSFDAGAKLLKIYLQRLADDYKSGAYLNYSKDFRVSNGFSSPDNPIHKDLNTLASGDKDAIHNLHFSPGLARALAMMWNNGEDIVNVKDIFNQSPNAHAHGYNMQSQQVNQDDLIPRD